MISGSELSKVMTADNQPEEMVFFLVHDIKSWLLTITKDQKMVSIFIIYWDLQQGLENILLQLAQVTETLKPVNLITVLPWKKTHHPAPSSPFDILLTIIVYNAT